MAQVPSPAPMPAELQRLVDEYLLSCRARGLSTKTVDGAYGYPLRQVFLPFCAREGITEVRDVNDRLMDRYSTELIEHGGKRGQLSRASVHAYVRNVNLFLTWARRQGEDISGRGQLPRLPRRHVDVLTRSEIDAIEEAASSERDKLIVRVLADTGMRAGELSGLRPADIIENGRHTFLRVRGKGGDSRQVPVMPALARRLRKHATHGRPSDAPDRVFLAHRRSPDGSIDSLHVSGVLQLVHSLAERAGVKKRVYSHLFRHSFITNALRGGMDVLQVAKIVGHSSLVMIQRNYEHLVANDSYDALARLLTSGEHD